MADSATHANGCPAHRSDTHHNSQDLHDLVVLQTLPRDPMVAAPAIALQRDIDRTLRARLAVCPKTTVLYSQEFV